MSLPIDSVLPALIEALGQDPCVVVKAPTGAGKTTRVPPALLDAGLAGDDGLIIMLEPRRVAARAAASRIASQRGQSVGHEVGYQVRFDRKASKNTRILIVTEGILVRMLQEDPFLEGVSVVVFDEFHERSRMVELALAMARRVQLDVRPELRLVVMSATLDPEPIAAWLDDCPIVVSQGRLFPVEVRYLPVAPRGRAHDVAASGVRQVLDTTSGDILTFLPGVGEIRRTAQALEDLERQLEIVMLYGDLPAEQQDRALRPGQRRKLVLATNVAETSLTIPGVTVVVDTGLAKIMRYDPGRGLNRLETERISQASADQRAGRAGRQQPGVCLRLWTEREQRLMEPFDQAEIQRVEMAAPALELLAWGEPSLEDFPWFESPPAAALEGARALLRQLGALEGDGTVTALGQQMVRWPVHPRLSRLIIEAWRLGHLELGTWAAALLSERDPFLRDASPTAGKRSGSDVGLRLEAVRRAAGRGGTGPGLHAAGVKTVARAQRQLEGIARRVLGKPPQQERSVPFQEALGRALLAAYPDRVARRRAKGSARARMVGGRGVELMPQSSLGDAPLFVCVDMTERAGKSETQVRVASAVERSWLGQRARERTVLAFEPSSRRVEAHREVVYGDDLVLERHNAKVRDDLQAAELLAQAALGSLDKATGLGLGPAAEYLLRLRALAGWMPELGLPTFEAGSGLEDLVLAAAQGRRSFEQLRRAPWLDLIKGQMTWPQQEALDRHAPERLQVPSGSRIRLTYAPDGPPVLAARIQELFGLTDSPTVAAGRVVVLMHLLAPNMRPQQITRDLRSFWANTYPEVRKELRQRYPKHAWPEDPWTAQAERRPRRRR